MLKNIETARGEAHRERRGERRGERREARGEVRGERRERRGQRVPAASMCEVAAVVEARSERRDALQKETARG